MTDTALNRTRRDRELERLPRPVDLLVIGGGVTGAGIALDAASRGLTVVLAEKHDLAHGTSRWSSKLIHGGLRYLATGNVSVAYESAAERAILMRRTAPHLTRALPQIVPLLPQVNRAEASLIRTGYLTGDLLRIAAGTPAALLPRSRRLSGTEVRHHAPTIRADGLRGGLVFWDGQLIDDARLVVALARTAAGFGARILTRCEAGDVTGTGAVLTDRITGDRHSVDARMVINATGVWAGSVAPEVALRPSRGSHLVFPREAFGGLTSGLMVPVPGARNRFVFALPNDERVYVGLTDEEWFGEVPDEPVPDEPEIDFLIETINTVLARPISRDDMLGSFAGLRPLLSPSADTGGGTADLSRRHAVITGRNGVITIVGGKLTTYRKMAAAAVDTALKHAGISAGRCRTRRLPLVGATSRERLARLPQPERLVRRYGTEAAAVTDGPMEPVAPGSPVTVAEFAFAVTHELALSEDDLLDRRTRIGLSKTEREAALPAARSIMSDIGVS